MAQKSKASTRNKKPAPSKKSSKKSSRNIVSVGKGFSTRKLLIVAVCFAVVGGVLLFRANAASKIIAIGVETPAAENSGMIASRQYPGVYWYHRDGGPATAEKPRDAIYALKFDANGVLQPVRGADKFPFYTVSGSTNNNWEDIAMDDENNIWIGDIGANKCERKDQKIFKVKEPNPAGTEVSTVLASYTFKFPDAISGCNTWNSEAMFWLDGKMYIFEKNDVSSVYRMDLPTGTTGTATLTRIGNLAGNVSKISVSSLSDDRSRLMVAGHGQMNMYKTINTSLKGDALVKDIISRTPAYTAVFDCACGVNASVEGGAFKRNSYDIAFVSEGKHIYYSKPSGYGDSTPPPPSVDATPPKVSITSPAASATLSGMATIGVDATDNVAVKRVDIFYDGTNVIREGTAPGTYGWGSLFDSKRAKDGVHTINVTAYDAANNKSSTQVSINVKNTVGDTTAPSVQITSPLNGNTVKGVIIINVAASDNMAVTRVDIFADGKTVIREGTAPGTYGWGSLFDTKKLTNGTHILNVKAYDAAGNSKTGQISVQVKN